VCGRAHLKARLAQFAEAARKRPSHGASTSAMGSRTLAAEEAR
jgi:hypothetical protein